MASIRTEFIVEADAERVWKTVGDWANGPADMARGHVVSSSADGPVRVVTFADAEGEGRCRFVWSRDVLPDELARPFLAAMREAGAVIRRTLEDR